MKLNLFKVINYSSPGKKKRPNSTSGGDWDSGTVCNSNNEWKAFFSVWIWKEFKDTSLRKENQGVE